MNTEKKQVRALIIDDHRIARDGLKIMLLSLRTHFDMIVGEAENGEDGLRKINQQEFNLVLVDYELPGISGAETVTRIRRFKPNLKVLAMSHNLELAYIERMQEAGINGYVQKGLEPAEMLEAIRVIHRNKMYYSSDVSVTLLHADRSPLAVTASKGIDFTRREKEVLLLLAEGFTNEAVAAKLSVGKRTADTHRQNMLDKFNAKNIAELIRIGFRMGVLK
jgi:DNA-binding NarL/FixJ family response regulator